MHPALPARSRRSAGNLTAVPSTITVRCFFHLRRTTATGYRYEGLPIKGSGSTYLSTAHPPAIGDYINLDTGTYRVVDRSWTHPEYGSMSWPYGKQEPTAGPMLTLIVEEAAGPFLNEVEGDCP